MDLDKPSPSQTPGPEPSDSPTDGGSQAPGSQASASQTQAGQAGGGEPSRPKLDPLAGPGVGSDPILNPLGSGRRQPPPGVEAPSRGWKKLRAFVVYPLIISALAAAAGIGVAASIRRPEVAELDSFVPRLVTEVFDRHEKVVRTYSRENRIMLREGEVPPNLQNAIVSTEDANFFQHGGVDLKGVARAAVTNFKAGEIREGASTITMQLSRALFSLTREQKWWRKVEEAFLSVELEKHYSKQQILTMYANMVNLGHGNYGMEAAARAYFNKSARDLDLAEAATLAGIPQRPNHFSVYRRPEAVIERRNWVLKRMNDEGYVTDAQFQEAVEQPLLVSSRRQEKELGPYFTEEVRRHLIETYGATELYDRGLQVKTTLDPVIQAAAERAVHDKLVELDHSKGWRGVTGHMEGEDLSEVDLPSWGETDLEPGDWFEGLVMEADGKQALIRHRGTTFELKPEGYKWTRQKRADRLLKPGNVAWFRLAPSTDRDEDGAEDQTPKLFLEQEPEMEAAALVIESSTGAVRAMVGGWSYERNEFNRAVQAKRQVGSAFKPFVFGAALENGFTAADTLFDGPAVFTGATVDDLYSPRNYYRKYYGIITLRAALEKSVNVAAVKLMDMVGAEQVIDLARRCGIQGDLLPYPSLALGAADLTPLELTASYAAIVNHGTYVEPYTIERIEARDGRLIYEHFPRAGKAMEPEVAYVLTKMLQGVSQRGTAAGRLARLPIETGGKTGTTNAYTDAWFVGFTPRYTILSWVGYDKKRHLGKGMTGAKAALPIWAGLVEQGLEEGWLEEGETFEPPPGIQTAVIDAGSGLLWGPGAGKKIEEVFVDGTEPEHEFDTRWQRIMSMPWYLQEPFYLPKEGERMPSQIADWTAVQEVWEKKNRGEDGDEPPAEEEAEAGD